MVNGADAGAAGGAMQVIDYRRIQAAGFAGALLAGWTAPALR